LISGTVEVAEALRAQLRIGDILYVLARRTDGPPMPLAVKRYNGPEFPAKFTLDKDSIMVPGTDFAGARNLVLIARISHSGSPAAQAGDLEGQIALGGPRANLKVLIDHQVK
jgi:cytochrome c-type biogenesis protein CcmH